MPLLQPRRINLPLICIIILAFVLRYYHLGYQSLWLDELHTMRVSDPDIPLSQLYYYLNHSDQHPPLFFLIEKLVFMLFGQSEMTARIFPAICGTASVWAMYLLGKELADRRLGLIAAAFTAVNAYNIQYSQEARGYIVAFFFTALSFCFFIRVLRTQHRKDNLLYALFTLLAMYSHYFGLLIPVAQAIIALTFYFTDRVKYRSIFRLMLMTTLILAGGYALWVPSLLKLGEIKSFWIPPVKPGFFLDYFEEYFGNTHLLNIICWGLFFYFMIRIFPGVKNTKRLSDPASIGGVIIIGGIFIMLLIPYLRSVTSFPILISRYTIVALPLAILGVSLGAYLIPDQKISTIVTLLFLLLSLKGLQKNEYYTRISKTQYRELTGWINANQAYSYPVINIRSPWQHLYYTRKTSKKLEIAESDPKQLISSLIKKGRSGETHIGFWLVDAHIPGPADKFLSPELQAMTDSNFVLAKERQFFDAWARLYILKP